MQVEELRMPYEATKFDLHLALAEEDGRIVGGLHYASGAVRAGNDRTADGISDCGCWRRWWPTVGRRWQG